MSKKGKITIESYNKTAEEYYKIVTSFEVLPQLKEFVNLVRPEGNILDLGCGPGHHSKIFVDTGFNVTGIDLSNEMIELAKKEEPRAAFIKMDITHLKFKKKSFDGIWASASLLHIPKNKIGEALNKIYSILRADGTFYISLKEGKGEESIQDDRYGGVEKFYSYYQVSEIKALLENIGFNILKFDKVKPRKDYDTNSWIHLICKKSSV